VGISSCSSRQYASSLLFTHTRLDPRIKRIKQEEKEAREAKKKNRGQATPGKKTKQEEEVEKKRAEEEA